MHTYIRPYMHAYKKANIYMPACWLFIYPFKIFDLGEKQYLT